MRKLIALTVIALLSACATTDQMPGGRAETVAELENACKATGGTYVIPRTGTRIRRDYERDEIARAGCVR